MVRLGTCFHVLGGIIVIFGMTMLLPLGFSASLVDGAAGVYAQSLLIAVVLGGLLWVATRRWRGIELQSRDGFLIVSLVWTVLPIFAALPLLFHLDGLSFTDAYFETTSALTTTGGTVLTQLEKLPVSLNIWRTQLQWMGGMGIIVLAVAILPLLGVGGAQIFKAETPGPMKDTKLTPRITQTAKVLWTVYLMMTVLCIISLKLAGMGWLDAMMHAFATMSLGGFSSHDASYVFFDSPTIEAVTIAFMLLAGINYATHFRFIQRRSLGVYARDSEATAFLTLMAGSILVIAIYLTWRGTYGDFWTAFRFAAFNTVSIATTTGFANTDYDKWPVFTTMWMMFLCAFASCSGSTGGGIKMIRALLMLKQALREFTRIIHPRAIIHVKLGGAPVENNIIFAVLAFMLIYGATMIGCTLLLLASGMDIVSGFTAVVACLNNTGPGLGQVGPAQNYQSLNDFQVWVCTAAMLLGRLELFTLFIVFMPRFWRQ